MHMLTVMCVPVHWASGKKIRMPALTFLSFIHRSAKFKMYNLNLAWGCWFCGRQKCHVEERERERESLVDLRSVCLFLLRKVVMPLFHPPITRLRCFGGRYQDFSHFVPEINYWMSKYVNEPMRNVISILFLQ